MGITARRLPQSLQELPRSCARLCLRIQHFTQELISPDILSGPVVVAFSGGADSTALAVILHCLGLLPHLAHLDHSLRPESHEEARKAAAFAQGLGIPLTIHRADVRALAQKLSMGIEETGRLARYRFLEHIRAAADAGWIVTGHQLEDLCEDQIMRLIRGTGWPALGGMAAVDWDRRLLRPLLATRRAELRAFLTALNIPWTEDPSNADTRFTRNRVRHTILPLLDRENPAYPAATHSLWRLAQTDESYWQSILQPVLQQIRQMPLPSDLLAHIDQPEAAQHMSWHLPRKAFVHLHQAARLRVYMALIRKAGRSRGRGQARAVTLFRFDRSCTGSQAVKIFKLPGHLLLITGAEGIYLFHAQQRSII